MAKRTGLASGRARKVGGNNRGWSLANTMVDGRICLTIVIRSPSGVSSLALDIAQAEAFSQDFITHLAALRKA